MPLWDATGGRGVLGLRHVGDLARHARGAPTGRRLVAAAQELAAHAADVLAAGAARRGWAAPPRAAILDAMC
jgi:hypothetical protein